MEAESYRYGLFSWYGIDTPLKERLRKIRDANFTATMLWWGDSKAFQEFDKRQLVLEVKANDLLIENIHVPFEKANEIWSTDEESRSHILGEYLKWLDDCSFYEIPMMVMHISRGDQIDIPNELGLRCLETLVLEAERKRINVALENTRKNDLIEFLLANIDSDNLGLCYDTSHAYISGDSDFRILERFRDRVMCFHLSDNDGQEDKHWNIGKGIIDWNKFITAFPREYNGILSAETVPKEENISEKEFIEDAYRRLKDLGHRIHMPR